MNAVKEKPQTYTSSEFRPKSCCIITGGQFFKHLQTSVMLRVVRAAYLGLPGIQINSYKQMANSSVLGMDTLN